MKCRDCGQEGFNSPNEITKHKRTNCPAKQELTTTILAEEMAKLKEANGDFVPDTIVVNWEERARWLEEKLAKISESTQEPAPEKTSLDVLYALASELGVGIIVVQNSKHLVIPRRFLPDETKYLGTNSYMGLKVRGYLREEGLVVQEQVEFLR